MTTRWWVQVPLQIGSLQAPSQSKLHHNGIIHQEAFYKSWENYKMRENNRSPRPICSDRFAQQTLPPTYTVSSAIIALLFDVGVVRDEM